MLRIFVFLRKFVFGSQDVQVFIFLTILRLNQICDVMMSA